MFKPNNQPKLLSFEHELEKKQRKQLNETPEKWFYQLILCSINERILKLLFSQMDSLQCAGKRTGLGSYPQRDQRLEL